MTKLCPRHWVNVCNLFVLFAPYRGIADLRHGYSMLQYGHKLDRRQITSYDKHSILDCVEDCLRTPRCQSINYYKGANFCQTNFENRTSKPDLYIEKPGWIYSAKEDWDKEIAGACSMSSCALNEKCIAKPFGNFSCDISDCGIPSCKGFSMNNVQEWDAIGIQRRIHITCLPGYRQEGSEQFVCQSDGRWKSNLKCTFKECYKKSSSNSTKVCLRFVETATTYPEANSDCEADCGDLVKIDTQTMKENFETFVKEHAANRTEIWVQGVKDDNGVWRFHNGVKYPDFLKQYIVESKYPNEKHLRYDKSKTTYIDNDPNKKYSYICEYKFH